MSTRIGMAVNFGSKKYQGIFLIKKG